MKFSKIGFGKKENILVALQNGMIDEYDILLLDTGEIAWVDDGKLVVFAKVLSQESHTYEEGVFNAGMSIDDVIEYLSKHQIKDGKDGYTPQKNIDYFDGNDGFSPVVAISVVDGGHRITFTDKDGDHVVDVLDGKLGDKGDRGNGIMSVVFNDDYTLTLTFDDGTNYTTPSLRGVSGKDGENGADGTSITHRWNGTKLAITSASGTSEVDLKGEKGEDGQDGYTPQKGVDYFDGKNGIDGKDGYTPQKGVDYFDGKDGADGVDGYTPVKGKDFFTETERSEMVKEVQDDAVGDLDASLDNILAIQEEFMIPDGDEVSY